MSHHIPWCGCDPNHLPTHARGKYKDCKFNDDPKEKLVRDTDEYLKNVTNVADAITLLRKWIDLYG